MCLTWTREIILSCKLFIYLFICIISLYVWYLSSNQKVTHDYSNLHFCSWRLFYFISPFKFSLNFKRISICLYFILFLSLSKLISWVKIQTCLSNRLWKPLNPKSNDDCPNLGQYFKCSGLLKCHSFFFTRFN